MATNPRENTILDRIVEARRESVAHRKRVLPDVALKMAVQKAEPPRDFCRGPDARADSTSSPS